MFRDQFNICSTMPATFSPQTMLVCEISENALMESSSSSCSSSNVKKFLPWVLYAILPLALFQLYFYPVPFSLQALSTMTHHQQSINLTINAPSPSSKDDVITCNYTNGKWIPYMRDPLYNDTKCKLISYGQRCTKNGRPDSNYLHWRWQPHQNQCRIPIFNPQNFLSLARNKHLAFIGDSLSRNQLESLICMLSTFSTPNLVYDYAYKFRRWNFPSHNLTVSSYWSPFLVKAIEKNKTKYYSELFLESVDEKWGSELNQFDTVVFTAGQWLLTPAVYFYNGSVIGCHLTKNCSDVGFYDVFGMMLKTTLNAVIGNRLGTGENLDIIVTTFPPAHFEGEWDKLGACRKTRPYEEGEKEVDGLNLEMRKVEMREIAAAKIRVFEELFGKVRLEVVDVTKLAWMRPDGHPGPYMNANPFADGIKDRVPNDCVHWCLPGH